MTYCYFKNKKEKFYAKNAKSYSFIENEEFSNLPQKLATR